MHLNRLAKEVMREFLENPQMKRLDALFCILGAKRMGNREAFATHAYLSASKWLTATLMAVRGHRSRL
jgi:hypothetical protein